jgi:glycosyltransferase involved in cell wall biosynthesis
MRVHLFGAVLAYDYLLAGWLRRAGVDAHYFFNFKHAEQDYPWWEDQTFNRQAMPAWCHYYPFRLPYYFRGPLSRTGRQFVRDFNDQADVRLIVGDGVFLAHRLRAPYVVWSCGYELEWAVPAPISVSGLVGRLRGRYEEIRLQRQLNRGYVRRQLRNAAALLIPMEFQVDSYLRRIGPTAPVHVVPMLYDCELYAPVPDAGLARRVEDVDAVFLLPTRHSYGSGTTNDKGADKVIRAFAAFSQKTTDRVRLILVEKGERLSASRQLVSRLGIGGQVEWIPQQTKSQLKAWYSLRSVVVLDQFPNEDSLDPELHAALRRHGSRGSIFAEAMCMGRPLISNVGQKWYREHAPPMVWDACSEAEIVEAMLAAMHSRAEWVAGGAMNREWAFRELHWENQIGKYVALLEAAARGASRP